MNQVMGHAGRRRARAWTTAVGTVLLMLAGGAQAQEKASEVTSKAAKAPEAQEAHETSLAACVRMPLRKPQSPGTSLTGERPGALRVNMRFTSPDQPPETEVVNSSAREDVRDLVLKYVSDYRLPCLTPGSEFKTSQVFSFADTPSAQRRMANGSQCIVPPAKPLDIGEFVPPGRHHILVQLNFDGDGQQAPKVRVAYSSMPPAQQAAVVAWAAGYRMPCRQAGDSLDIFEQLFSMEPEPAAGSPAPGLSMTSLDLADFLKRTDHPERLRASFDFNTMGCPFLVRYRNGAPIGPNLASAGEPEDPRRAELLRWLTGLRLASATPQQADDLYGATFQINVPCGQLELSGAQSPVRHGGSGDLFKSGVTRSAESPETRVPSHD